MKKILLFATLFLTACAPVATSTSPPATTAPAAQESPQVTATSYDLGSLGSNPQVTATSQELTSPVQTQQPAPTNARIEDDTEYVVPRMLPFDAIKPVYDPLFAPASEAGLNDDELVMGVAIDGQAKAYPVTVLQFREMVDDELAGWPILVTW